VPDSPWERHSENWIQWARTPGHDAYWQYRDAFFDQIVPEPPTTTLEIGCGEGRVTRDLVARDHRVVAMDLIEAMVRAAREADTESVYAQADSGALPLRDGSLDLVVAYNSLMDVDDMPRGVAEVARVLRPGGYLCMCLVHPLRDAGDFESDEPDAAFVMRASYFEKRWLSDTIERDGLKMTFEGWSFRLEEYFDAIAKAGLVVDRLKEPQPTASASTPEWSRFGRFPLFLFVRARKP
jgi:ubiquinone/menaquinone biosynthesis C-methylase UbiE